MTNVNIFIHAWQLRLIDGIEMFKNTERMFQMLVNQPVSPTGLQTVKTSFRFIQEVLDQ